MAVNITRTGENSSGRIQAGKHDMFVPATVLRVVTETTACRSFDLCVSSGVEARFAARPGQFLPVRVIVDGITYERTYSLSSTPMLGEPLRLTIKRIPGGRVSNWCNDELHASSSIEVAPPRGRFVLRSDGNPLLMFAAGSGITPIFSLLRHALTFTEVPLLLVDVNRSASDAIFRDCLRDLQLAAPTRFTLIEHFTRGQGRLTAEATRALCALRPDADVYLCGPDGFMGLVEYCAIQAGIAENRIFLERFVPVALDDTALPATPDASVDAEVTVRLDGQQHVYACPRGNSVLDAALAAGLKVPFSCQEGHCGTCLVKLTEGNVELPQCQGISKRDRKRGFVLACQARATTPRLAIDYDA